MSGWPIVEVETNEENIRLESWKHAQNHGVAAGKNITGIKTELMTVLTNL